ETVAYSGPDLSAQKIDGLSISVDVSAGNPQNGDSWLVQPFRSAAGDIGLKVTDPAQIAAADGEGGSANGENALDLAKLQTDKVLGGKTMSLNDAFSQLVNKVGVLTQKNSSAAKAQNTLIQQNYAAQQNVS